jgi:beta-mannosidase
MKWAIVDNYQKPKRSFDFVKKAYQPLLVNLNFTKRRWKKTEAFNAELWVVNDLYKEYPDCTVDIVFKNELGTVLKSEELKIGKIPANSAKKYMDLTADVLDKVNAKVFVELLLHDKSGNHISSNDYFFLIGDQVKASEQFKEKGRKLVKKNSRYTYGNYYRFFDEMTRENGKDYKSGSEKPKAQGFDKD